MIPPRVADEIKAQFPHARLIEHRGDFLSGFAVEIEVGGEPWRNAWVINPDTDWDEIKERAIKWLMSHSPC